MQTPLPSVLEGWLDQITLSPDIPNLWSPDYLSELEMFQEN